jgi:hypothetical protein
MDADFDASGDLNDGGAGEAFGSGVSARSNRIEVPPRTPPEAVCPNAFLQL